MIVEHPVYFGPADTRLFGVVHWPADACETGVVVCPPLGYERACAHHGVRELAIRLAEQGHPVLRFDYAGRGNSIRSEPGGGVGEWVDSVHLAIEEIRRLGAGRVVLVGLRFGALLAATVAGSVADVDGLVLWDPIASGRRYARTLQLLSSVEKEFDDDDDVADGSAGVVVGGVEFDACLLEDMKSLRSPDLSGRSVLVIHRSGDDLTFATEVVDMVAVDEMEQFIDVDAELSVLPQRALQAVTSWMRLHFADRVNAAEIAEFDQSTSCTIGDLEVRHRLRRIGEGALFVVDSAPLGVEPRRVVVMLNNGVAPNIGPGGAWIDFERRLLQERWRVVRMDIGGIGNSPAGGGCRANIPYPPRAGSEIREVVDALRSEGVDEIVLLGLCSGSLNGYDAVAAGADVDAIVSINGRFDRPYTDTRRRGATRSARATNRLLAIPLRKTPLFPALSRIPAGCWKLLDLAHLVAPPTTAIGRAGALGVRSLLLFGPDEWGLRALRLRDDRRLARLCESGLVEMIEMDGLDHSMFRPSARRRVEEVVIGYLRGLSDIDAPVVAAAVGPS